MELGYYTMKMVTGCKGITKMKSLKTFWYVLLTGEQNIGLIIEGDMLLIGDELNSYLSYM